MKRPLVISLGFHAAILLAALVVLPTPEAFKVPPPEAIQVDISAVISDKSQKMATTKDPSPPADTPAPKETKVVKDVPPAPKVDDKINTASHEPSQPPPEPDKKPDPPKPDTKALDQLLKAEDQKQKDLQQQADEAQAIAEAQKQAEDKKKAEEKKKAEDAKKKAEQKAKLDKALAEAQAQLNKIAGENTAPAKPSDKKGAPKQADKNTAGNDAANTATIAAALIARVKECFNIPPAAREKNISVPIHFLLNADGSVNGQPEVQGESDDPVFQATARAAVSAIAECAPFQLPADQYDQWKDNLLDFNPTQLSG
ncbi:MAG: cell envelope integrity protein TolA [Alphaproteobacteria bacterium]|nr:cell envelope integrity protein TolA [Alphaproteobacteria bacterium]